MGGGTWGDQNHQYMRHHQPMTWGQTTHMSFLMSLQNMKGPQTIGKQHSTMTENPIPTWIEARTSWGANEASW